MIRFLGPIALALVVLIIIVLATGWGSSGPGPGLARGERVIVGEEVEDATVMDQVARGDVVSLDRSFELDSTPVPVGRTADATWRLTVRVKAAKTPVVGVTVRVPELDRMVTTDAQGRARFDVSVGEDITVVVTDRAASWRVERKTTCPSKGSGKTIVVDLFRESDAHHLDVVVKTERTGRPIEGAKVVELLDPSQRRHAHTSTTDGDGRARLPWAEDCRVVVTAEGHTMREFDVSLSKGGQPFMIELRGSATVYGRLAAVYSPAVDWLRPRIEGDPLYDGQWPDWRAVRGPHLDGSVFLLQGEDTRLSQLDESALVSGRAVRVVGDRWAIPDIDFSPNSTELTDLSVCIGYEPFGSSVSEGFNTYRVLASGLTLEPGAKVEVTDPFLEEGPMTLSLQYTSGAHPTSPLEFVFLPEGFEIGGPAFSIGGESYWCDELEIAHLPRGRWAVYVRSTDLCSSGEDVAPPRPVSIGTFQCIGQERAGLTLVGLAAISGLVLDEAGAPCDIALVSFERRGQRRCTLTDELGRFHFDGLESGAEGTLYVAHNPMIESSVEPLRYEGAATASDPPSTLSITVR